MDKMKRIYGLDAARAILLVGGPLVHAYPPDQNLMTFQYITDGSDLFRMSAFFAVAGFLVGLNPRATEASWITARFRQLGIPLLSMTIVMMILGVLKSMDGLRDGGFLAFYPLHLWFLFSLLIITPITVIMDHYSLTQKIGTTFDRHPRFFLPTCMILAILCIFFFRGVVYLNLFKTGVLAPLFGGMLTKTPVSCVMYLLGFFLARQRRLLDNLNTPVFIILGPVLWVIAMTFYLTHPNLGLGDHSVSLPKIIDMVLNPITRVTMSLSIILLALRATTVHKSILWFSRSSYSVYLFHLPFIIILGFTLRKIDPHVGPYTYYAIIVTASLVASYLAHIVVSQSQILLFLFNGRKLTMSFYISTPKGKKTPNKKWNKTFVFLGHMHLREPFNQKDSVKPSWVFMRVVLTRVDSSYKRLWCLPQTYKQYRYQKDGLNCGIIAR